MGMMLAFILSSFSIIVYDTFHMTMSDTELNKLTFTLFIFEGIGEICGGLLVIILSKKITSSSKAYIGIASFFLVGFILILIATRVENYYLMGVGITLCGICDCAGLSISGKLAGKWL